MSEVMLLADAPPAEPQRPRVLLVGSLLAGSAMTAAIGAMIVIYVQLRVEVTGAGDSWLPEETSLPLTPGNMAMISLLMSAITVSWAIYALRNDDRPHAFFALGLTQMFGVAFMVDTAYLWGQLGIGIADSAQATLIYTITGTQLAMVALGMIALLVMGFRALGGQLTGRAAEGLYAAALFWFMTIGVYSVVWYAIYITK